MTTHLYEVGAHVSLAAAYGQSSPTGVFIVEAQLPPVGTNLQYRIKSETEGFRRVVVEHQLTPVGAVAPVMPVATASVHPGEED